MDKLTLKKANELKEISKEISDKINFLTNERRPVNKIKIGNNGGQSHDIFLENPLNLNSDFINEQKQEDGSGKYLYPELIRIQEDYSNTIKTALMLIETANKQVLEALQKEFEKL